MASKRSSVPISDSRLLSFGWQFPIRRWRNGQLEIDNRKLAIFLLLAFSLSTANALAQGNPHIERLERASGLISSNQLTEAERQLNQVLRVAPNEALALNLMGTVRAKQGRLKEAETLFSRALTLDSRLIGARMNLAYLYLLRGERAKTALQLKEVLRVEPNNPEARYRYAWVLLAQARFDECINFIEKIKEAEPLSIPLIGLLGEAYLKRGDVGKAEELYLQVLNEQKANADALLGLASVSRVKRDASSAMLYLSRARDVVGESPDLLYKFALVAVELGLRDEAVSSLQRAIKLKPAESSYHYVLGISWLNQPPDLQEAEKAFRESVRLEPSHGQAQLHLGYVLLKQKKYPEAREMLEMATKTLPASPEALYYLGLIAQEQNENERAVALLEKAIHLAPSFANAHIALGSTYLKLKNYSRARQELEAGVKLSPEDSKAHYNLAILYTRLKDPERAKAEMRIVEELKGKNTENDPGAPLRPPD